MRVGIAHYCSQDDISGVTSWLVRMIRRMRADGFEVGLHLVRTDDSKPEKSTILQALEDENLNLSISQELPSLEENVRETLRFLDQWKPDFFMPQCRPSHYVAAAIAGDAGLPWALTLHSDDPDYWSAIEAFPPGSHGGHTVCVSSHIRDKVLEQGLDLAPLTIACGIEIPANKARFSREPFRVAYLGRLWEHQKRISLVIETMIRVCRAHKRFEGLIIGDGYSLPSCRQRVEEAGLSARIHFTGKLTPDQAHPRLADVQAILLMSDFEGLPVALIEAMAAGVVPVVRAIASGIPELIHHEQSGLLVSDDPGEAAQALIRLADDHELWNRCAAGAMATVRQSYTFSATYERWLELLAAHAPGNRDRAQAIPSLAELPQQTLTRYLTRLPASPKASRASVAWGRQKARFKIRSLQLKGTIKRAIKAILPD